MKQLRFVDVGGNDCQYHFAVDDALTETPLERLLQWAVDGDGPLSPQDALLHGSFRTLVGQTPLSLNRPLRYFQGDHPLEDGGRVTFHEPETVLFMGRDFDQAGPALPSPEDFARRNRELCSRFKGVLLSLFDKQIDLSDGGIWDHKGRRVTRFSDVVDGFSARFSPDMQRNLLYRVALALHRAPFENISRFFSEPPVLPGYLFFSRVAEGGGGVCSEKTAALKVICDLLEVPVAHLGGGFRPPPLDLGERIAEWVADPEGSPLPPWVQHHLLEVKVGEAWYLVDVTGGNAPLIFLGGEGRRRILNRGLRLRQVYRNETIRLARLAPGVGEALLLLTEFHARGARYDLVLEQALGLATQPDLFVGAFLDWGGERSFRYQTHYAHLARRGGHPPPRFLPGPELAGALRRAPQDAILSVLPQVREGLLLEHPRPEYTGDVTFVIQPLHGDRWQGVPPGPS